TLVEEILGIQFILGDIVLTPKLMPRDFFKNNIQIKYAHAGATINLSYINPLKKRNSSGRINEKAFEIKSVFLEEKTILKTNNKYIIKKGDLVKLKKKELHLKIYLA
ncbi:MAG: hypothetical protein KAT28_04605, partial [Candidatus Aenigmarchaeota archaeon]|nr:hypothetical protein [Candidatus Aenigmarchaeota archaeon]